MADIEGYDSPEHHTAQAGCRHLIHCAVDTPTRSGVIARLDYCRQIGDMGIVPILIAQLSGPCCLPASMASTDVNDEHEACGCMFLGFTCELHF